MPVVVPGRFTAEMNDPFVVFLIGLRINNFFAVNKWLPTAMAMAPMLRSLKDHPEQGFLGAESFFAGRSAMLMQYWRSLDDLERFARNPTEPHLAAWQRFNRAIGGDGSVGIWHETYVVQPGNYESVYVNMPVFGLAAATRHVPATGRRETARGRMTAQS